jgi:hypothetical protein
MYTYVGLIVFVTITIVNGARVSDTISYSIESINNDTNVDLSICQDCIQESVNVINVLLILILDEGIIASCGDLCNALANKTNSTVDGDICLAVCNAVGIGEFIKLLEHTDLDAIWYCQIAKLCSSKKNILSIFIQFEH